jgi:hypothetical protein
MYLFNLAPCFMPDLQLCPPKGGVESGMEWAKGTKSQGPCGPNHRLWPRGPDMPKQD